MSGKYEIDHDDRYDIDDDRYESGNDYSGPTGTKTATMSSASYSNDGHKFTIINGVVTAVFELENGITKQERIDANETWSIQGSNVVKTEKEYGVTQTSVYSDTNGDGIWNKVSETYVGSNGQMWTEASHGSDGDDSWNGTSNSDDYYGSNGNDHLNGYSGVDHLFGGDGDDHLRGGVDNDDLNGGVGIDTAEYFGSHDQYEIAEGNGTLEIHDKISARDSIDTLSAIEQVKFSDGTLVFDHTSSSDATVYRLYQAALGRTPDTDGFRFWANQVDSKVENLDQVAHNFLSSAEFKKEFGENLTDDQFATALYKNVLGRTPDAEGLSYWTKALSSGLSDEHALLGFAESKENVQLTGSHMENGFWTT